MAGRVRALRSAMAAGAVGPTNLLSVKFVRGPIRKEAIPMAARGGTARRQVRRPLVQVRFDPPGGYKEVGDAVRLALGGRGPRWAVSAYVTRDIVKVGRRRGSGRPIIVCDALSGNSNPHTLVELSKTSDVFCREGLHAKVYRGPGGVAVGSANLGRDALQADGALLEAMLTTRDEVTVAAADRWLKALLKDADTIPLAKLRAKKETWATLLKRWEDKCAMAGSRPSPRRGGRGRRPAAEVPTLRQLLESPNSPAAVSVMIEIITGDGALSETTVERFADDSGIILPEGWSFSDMIVSPHEQMTVVRRDTAFKACDIVTVYGSVRRMDAAERLRKATGFDGPMRLIDVVPGPRGRVLWLVGPSLPPRVRVLASDTSYILPRINKALTQLAPRNRPDARQFLTIPALAALLGGLV